MYLCLGHPTDCKRRESLILSFQFSFRLRHASKNSTKDDSDITSKIETKLPTIKIPAKSNNLPPQAGFCLECEHCTTKNCNHLTHSRKIYDDLACHARDSGHKRFQLVNFFILIRHAVKFYLMFICVEQRKTDMKS